MKIAININELTLSGKTGVQVYTQEIVNALSKIDVKNKYTLYANCSKDTAIMKLSNKKFKLKTEKTNYPFWTYLKFPKQILKDRPDILFMPIQAVPFFKKPKNIKIVVTVHDLAFLLFPKYFTRKDKLFLKFHTKRAVMMADKIIVPSEATKQDIIKFYKIDESKITVVHHGITLYEKRITPKQNDVILRRKDEESRNHSTQNSESANIKNNLSSQTIAKSFQPYLLFVGVIQPRKNIIRLIEAFEIAKEKNQELKLVIVGKRGWQADETYKRAIESRFSQDIIFLGGVSDHYLLHLYQNARAFVLPSLYEGFGMPVSEAMNYEVPCIVSDNSSLSEIAGDSALLVDPYNVADISEKIEMICQDEVLRQDLVQKGIKRRESFNWKKSAEKTLEVFNSSV